MSQGRAQADGAGSIRRVLVTGGAGFIGSNVVRLLCDRGLEVTAIDDLSFGHDFLVDRRCRLIVADFANRDELRGLLPGTDAVVHLAASSIIEWSFERPSEYVENNVLKSAILLDEMVRAGVRSIVFSSSAAVYGEPARIPIDEDDLKAPMNVYGATKLAFEHLLATYWRCFEINSVSLRYFNAYGPGDLQEPVSRAVPAWIRAALTGRSLKVYWEGAQLRDYVFVDDIAQAHVQALGLPGSRVYNIGSGTGVRMADIVGLLRELVDRPIDVHQAGERRGDPMRLVADTSRIREETGWQPNTSLRDGLARTVEFFQLTRERWQGS